MATIESVRDKARTVIRNKLSRAAPSATTSQLDKTTAAVCAELDKSRKTVSSYQQGLMLVGMNCEVLGPRCVSVAAKILLTEDTSGLKALIAEDVEERKITNEFAASEICDKCGLPKANTKMNINKMDVEDEVFGKQFDYVFNDICTCHVDELLASAKTKNGDGNDDNEQVSSSVAATATAATKTKDDQVKNKNSILALWEEQNDIAEKEQQQQQQQQAEGEEKSTKLQSSSTISMNILPERRTRE